MNFTFFLLLCLLKQWLEAIEEEQLELEYEQSHYHHLGYSTLDLQHF
ncbi:MAG: hypothetical protein ACLFV6_16965 [Spirulinaceae cyanobacterium]